MSDWITIEGIKPWDGTYPFEIFGDEPLTTREWGFIKRLSGYLPTDITVRDPEVICAFAAIALYRAGRIPADDVKATFDRIIDAPFGSAVRLETDDQVEEDDGDAVPPPSGTGSSETSSGNVSPLRSETSEPVTPAPSGTPGWGTSVSAPTRSETGHRSS